MVRRQTQLFQVLTPFSLSKILITTFSPKKKGMLKRESLYRAPSIRASNRPSCGFLFSSIFISVRIFIPETIASWIERGRTMLVYITPSTLNIIFTLSETASMWTSEALPSRACLKNNSDYFCHRPSSTILESLLPPLNSFFLHRRRRCRRTNIGKLRFKSPKARETSPPNPLYSSKTVSKVILGNNECF